MVTENEDPVVLVDKERDAHGFVKPAVLDGKNKSLLEENRICGDPDNGIPPMSHSTVDNIFKNA